MSIDLSKLQLSAKNNSLKLLQEGSGTLVVPAGSSTPGGNDDTEGTATIAHNYGSTELFWFVTTNGISAGSDYDYILPFYVSASGSAFQIFSHIDEDNLYITGFEQANTTASGFSTTYSYRIFIP